MEMLEHMGEIVACIEEKLMCEVGWLEQTEANQAGAVVKLDCVVERWDCSQVILVPELEWRNCEVEMLEHMGEIVACVEEKLMLWDCSTVICLF